MIKVKLSPSKIETHRKYVMEEYAGTITKEKVIASIKGEEVWSAKALFGSAAHLVMQFGAEKYYNEEQAKYVIQDSQMPEPILLSYQEIEKFDLFHKEHPNMIWESKATLVIIVDGFEVTLNMRIDAMEGLTIHENKTSSNDLDFDFFEASYQWKCYFLATKAEKAQYNVFSYYEPNTKRKEYEVFYDFMTLFPYKGLEEDVKQGIRELIQFCRIYNLMPYITKKD